jgi:hypothetical protein
MKIKSFRQGIKNRGIRTNYPTELVDWSTGRNVRFFPGGVAKDLGKTLLVAGVDPVREFFTFMGHDGVVRTVVCTDTTIKAYTNDFTTVEDITPTVAPAAANARWQFALVAGLLLITNGVDGLWSWSDYANPVQLETMAGFGGDFGRIGVLGKSMNRLLLADFVENGGTWKARARWGNIAKPLTMGEGVTDTNGYKDLVDPMESEEASETILAYSSIGRRTLAFTNQNIWFLDPAEAPEDYTAVIGAGGYGLLAAGLVVKTDKRAILFAGKDDFYLFGGSEAPTPIGFDIRNSCFPNLNKAALASSFGYYKPATKEVYFCVPTGSNTSPDTAFVYQLETKAWSIKDVDYTCFGHAYDNTNFTWDDNPFGAWDSITDSRWDEMTKNGVIPYGIVGDASGNIYKVDVGYNNNGAPFRGVIETGDMVFGSELHDKHITALYPAIKPQTEERPLMIQVGVRESLHHDIQWSYPQAVGIGSGVKADFRARGKYIRFRFFTELKDSPFMMEGHTTKYFMGGSR